MSWCLNFSPGTGERRAVRKDPLRATQFAFRKFRVRRNRGAPGCVQIEQGRCFNGRLRQGG